MTFDLGLNIFGCQENFFDEEFIFYGWPFSLGPLKKDLNFFIYTWKKGQRLEINSVDMEPAKRADYL